RSSSHGGRCGGQGPDGAPGEVDFVSDWSPLHEASIHGRLLALKKLINQVWCVNFRTTDCVSPLHEACLGGHAACVSVLLKHGANVNATTIDWNTPLFNACVSGSVDCLNLLLQHRASPHPVCDLASPSMKEVQLCEMIYSLFHSTQILYKSTNLSVVCTIKQISKGVTNNIRGSRSLLTGTNPWVETPAALSPNKYWLQFHLSLGRLHLNVIIGIQIVLNVWPQFSPKFMLLSEKFVEFCLILHLFLPNLLRFCQITAVVKLVKQLLSKSGFPI
uniref:Ankyrin repeat and SOCS box containing 9 n=1 Tax=Naja naja TaxID=35670 RepID=A0A8C7E5J5_NAJNA